MVKGLGLHHVPDCLFKSIMNKSSSRKKQTQAPQQTPYAFEHIFQSIGDGILITDEKGYITRANRALEDMLGFREKEIVGRHSYELTPQTEEHRSAGRAMIEQFVEKGVVESFETELVRKDGSLCPIEVTMTRLFDEQGNRAGGVGTFRDITRRKKAEAELRQARDHLQNLIESSQDFIIVADEAGCIRSVNKYFADALGYPADEMTGHHIVEYMPRDCGTYTTTAGESVTVDESYFQDVRDAMETMLTTGRILNWVSYFMRRDKTLVPVEQNAVLLYDENGDITGSFGILRDMAERIRIAAEKRESEELFSSLIEAIDDPILIADEKGDVIEWNPAMVRITGIEREDACGCFVAEIQYRLTPSERKAEIGFTCYEDCEAAYRDFFAHGIDESCKSEQTIRNIRDGSCRIFESIVFPIKSPKGFMFGNVCHDITERKKAEEALLESEKRFRSLIEACEDPIMISDEQGKIVEWNPAMTRVSSIEKQEAYGMSAAEVIFKLMPPERKVLYNIERYADWEELFNNFLLQSIDTPFKNEVMLQNTRDGSCRTFESIIFPIKTPKGTMLGNLCHDITERKKAEEALLESEKRFRSLIETSEDPICLADENGTIVEWNPAFADVSGVPSGEAVGSSLTGVLFNLIPDTRKQALGFDSFEKFDRFFGNYLTTGLADTVKIDQEFKNRRDGTVRVFDSTIFPIKTDRGFRIANVNRDITERKHADDERRRLTTALDQAAETVLLMDESGHIRYINAAMTSLMGYSPLDVIGKNPFLLQSGEYTSDFYKNVWETVSAGKIWSGRMKNKKRDGTMCEIEATITPIRDKNGSIISYVSIGRDITHELHLERQLRQAQKMESVGTLAGGIAHDFNNILAAILGYAELTLSSLDDRGRVEQNIDQVLKSATRAKNLVKQILTFSRQTEQEKCPVQMNGIIKDTVTLLRATLPTTVDIRHTTATHAYVFADPTQMQQVLMNLGANAAYALRDSGGVLKFSAQDAVIDSGEARQLDGCEPGSYVRITVSDTGTGISPDIIDRIFDPFFTTKSVGEGTGMGLSLVHGIIKSHGGHILVDSTLNEGTAFTILLPEYAGEGDRTEPSPESLPPGGSENVLFVDDEASLVEIGREMLEMLGYTVTGVQSSKEALALFTADPGTFDLVITDHTMPGMTGYDLAREMLKIRPDIPVMLCTGYSETVSREKARAAGIREFVMKPINLQETAKIIRRVLDAPPHPAQ